MVNTSIIAILAAAILAASTEVAITTAATVYGQQPPQKDRSDNGGLAATLNATGLAATLNDTNFVKGDTVAVNGINATTNATVLEPAFVSVWRCYLPANVTIQPGAYFHILCQVQAFSTASVLVTNNDAQATVISAVKLSNYLDEQEGRKDGRIMIVLKNDNVFPINYGLRKIEGGITLMVFQPGQDLPGQFLPGRRDFCPCP
jgi:hypothetical protein